MRLVIVGHGTSLADRELGAEIDEFDWVCKVKRGSSPEKAYLETPERAGARCDAVAAPLRPRFKGVDVRGCSEFWAVRLVKHRRGDHGRWRSDLNLLERRSLIPIITAYAAMTYWGDRYSTLLPEAGPSSGLESIIVGLEHYHPPELHLAGFDQMQTGQQSSWAKRLGKDPHPAAIERRMLDELREFYQVRIEFL